MTIRALVLDMDDTLFAERDYVVSGFAAVERYLGINGFRAEAVTLFESGQRTKIFDDVLERLGIRAGNELLQRCLDAYRDHEPDIRLLPDARWLMNNVVPGVSLALISDGYSRTQRLKLAALEVADRFDCIVISDELGRDNWKPSPVPYEYVSAALGLHPEQCVYVGDNPAKDFVTARRLGWLTVRVERANGTYRHDPVTESHRADHRVGDLRDLINIRALAHMFTDVHPRHESEPVTRS